MGASGTGSSVLRETRWLGVFLIPFLVVAFVILYVFPTETARFFAWDIKPPMTAMMLGAAYAGGVWFFARSLRARTWREIKIGFPAVGTFASILGIATILHWDKFIQANPAFYAWFGLYFTTPFLVFVAWYRQRQRETGTSAPELVLPRVAQRLFGLIGAGILLISVGLFLVPTVVADVWPWTVTPLTARVVSAMFSLTGVVAIGMALDPRWSAFRILAEAQVFSIALILLAVWRDQADIHFGSPSAWIFTLGLIGVMVLLIALSVAMDRRARTWSGSAVPA